MWGIPTIKRLNDEAAEAAEIMKAKGYDVPKIERSADAPPEVHIHIPLGEIKTPAERAAEYERHRDAAFVERRCPYECDHD